MTVNITPQTIGTCKQACEDSKPAGQAGQLVIICVIETAWYFLYL